VNVGGTHILLAKELSDTDWILIDRIIFYEQMDGSNVGSPLPPVVANFFMEDFEEVTMSRVAYKSTCWFRYIEDKIVTWPC